MDIKADLRKRAGLIASSLKIAFGGASQVGDLDIARAIAGNINNNGLAVHGTLAEVCDAVFNAFYADWEGDFHFRVDGIFILAQEALEDLFFDWESLPHASAGG